MLHDDEGENISGKNASYCELTGQYWAWKNVQADYYGFLHYRRYFNFSNTKFEEHHESFIFGDVVFDKNDDAALDKINFREDAMREVIESHDFVAPTAIATPDGANVYDQYRMSTGHHIEDFDCVLDMVRRRYPEVWPSAEKYLNQPRLYVCNMFVMRGELFDEYSRFLFDILGSHERLTDISHYTAVGRRVSGYLGERLCGMWLTYLYDRGLDGVNLQRVFFRDVSNPPVAALPGVARDAAEPSAGVEFGSVTRGSGKIYVPLSLAEDVCAARVDGSLAWRVENETDAGVKVPGKVVMHSGRDVLVLPVLAAEQRVHVSLCGAGDVPVASASRRFSARWTTLESRKNTLLRDHDALDVRNCDEEDALTADDARVVVERVVADVDGTDVVQGTVTFSASATPTPRLFCEILAIGPDGRQVSVGDWVCLGDRLLPVSGYPGVKARRVTFSLRVPQGGSFAVWVRFPDGGHQDAFACVQDFVARDMREAFRSLTTPAEVDKGYDEWFRRSHRATPLALSLQRERVFRSRPLFSIIVPLFKTPLPFFRDMAGSVLAQTYGNWELICVNASPEDAELASEVASWCALDSRIREVCLPENRGITENTNEGIKVAKGDFLCFFDHDDVLEPDALYWYADALEDNAQIDLFYCDEDKLVGGAYANPFFKPDWNPDLLLGMNYVCHFLAVRKAIVDGLELPTREYDGSQDYHMTFRVGEQARSVRHVPRVLYHWRVHENSTAMSAGQKDYALETSRLAVKTHLERCGIRGEVVDSKLSPRRFVVSYDLSDAPLVSIIIPNKDNVDVLNRCLASIRLHTTYPNYEVVVVENNSEAPETFTYYQEQMETDDRLRVVKLEGMDSFNFSRIINYGAAHARGEYLLMLNNDTEVITSDWIEQLLGPCTRPDVGATGAKLLFPDGLVQHAGVIAGREGPCHAYYQLPARQGGNFEATLVASDVMAVTGAALLVRRDVYDAVGGMDETLAVNYNDVDFCLKVNEGGWRVVFCPEAQLYHYESVSRGDESFGPKAVRFRSEKGEMMRRWPELYECGGAFGNPNLALGDPYAALDHGRGQGVLS